MAGTFLDGEIKTRPGVYYRTSRAGLETAGATNGILAMVFHGNWGIVDKVKDLSVDQMNDLEKMYGDAADILREGFRGGAKTIRAIRANGTGGAPMKVTLKGGTDGSKDVLELSARFDGSKDLSVSIKKNLVTNKRQMIIYDGAAVFETAEFAAGGDESAALAAALELSDYFKGTSLNAGVLADVTQKALSGGKNPVSTTANYSTALNLLESYKWNVLCADESEAELNQLLTDYVRQSYETGHLGMLVLGGRADLDLEGHMAQAAALDDWRIVYVMYGWDDIYGKRYLGANAAARIGGMIAGSETSSSLTHATIQDALTLVKPLSNGDMTAAEEKGCLVFSLNSNGQVQIDNAINTLVTPKTNQDSGWKKIKRAKIRFELMDRINSTCEPVIGKVNNDRDGRATVIAAMNGVIAEMVAEGKLFQGSYATEDTGHKPAGDRAYFVLVIGDVDSLEKIYLNFTFSYSNPFE